MGERLSWRPAQLSGATAADRCQLGLGFALPSYACRVPPRPRLTPSHPPCLMGSQHSGGPVGEVVEERRPQGASSGPEVVTGPCLHAPATSLQLPASSWHCSGSRGVGQGQNCTNLLWLVFCLLDKSSRLELAAWHPCWSRKETVPIGHTVPFSYRALSSLPSILNWSTVDKGTRKIGIAQR